MAISITWGTKVIYVPVTYLTLLSGTIYELDSDQMRLDLKGLEDDVEGMPFNDTHRHNTTVAIAGIVYARTVEIINDYSVEFEDGQYTVIIKGSNNNFHDVLNGILVQNQVQVIPTNSAGLIEVGTSGLTSGEAADLAAAVEQATLARKIGSNKAVIAPDELSVVIYDDDESTPLYEFDVSSDKRTRTPA